MGTLEVRLFGAPEIRRDGEPVSADTRKAIAILAVLAAEGRPVRRDVLATLLWPEATQERARASLRRTLSALRTAVGSDAIEADRETIALTTEPHTVDVVAFAEFEPTRRRAAVELYRGPFLEGFSVGDSIEFEDWQRSQAEQYRRRVDALLAALAEEAAPHDAVAHALRRLALDPLNEAAARQAMAAYGAAGDRNGAIAVYRELVRRLDADLAVAPLPETTETYETVRRGTDATPPPLSAEPAAPHHAMSPEIPELVGRDHDLAALATAMEHCRLVVLTGEPGIGRSRLLSEWVRTTGEQVAHLALRCHPGEQTIPYAPLAEWLGSTAAAPSRTALFEELAAALPLASGGVLAVDDLHLADPGTIAFLTYLLHRPERFGLRVLATWRGDVDPGSSLWELLAEGRRESWATALAVTRLGDDDARALIDASGAASSTRTDEILALAAGLPLVIVECLRLQDHDGLPPVVADLMRSRLAALSPLARQLVDALAVIERPADPDLVQFVAGRTEVETASAIDEATAGGILGVADDRLELTHHLLGLVALHDLTDTRIRVLRLRAAEVLPAAEAADQVGRAGRHDQAADLHLRAAAEAMEGQALSVALHHLHAHLEASARAGRSDDAAVHRRIGEVEAGLGHYDAARRALEISAARSTGPDLVDVELDLARLALRSNDPHLATSHLDSAAAELAATDEPAEPRVHVELAMCRAVAASATEPRAADQAQRAIELAVAAGDPRLEAGAEHVAALVAHRRGDAGTTADHARAALRLAQLADAPLVEAAAANLLGLTRSTDGDHDQAVTPFEQALAILRRHGDVHRLAAVHANLGDALHRVGRDDEARRHQLESARLFSEVTGSPLDGRADLWLLTAW